MQEFTLKPVSPMFLPRLAALEAACFSAPWSEQVLAETLADPSWFLAAACSADGVLAGYGGLQQAADEGYIGNIAVSPGFRRQGVGSLLLSGLLDEASHRSLMFVSLEVRASNKAAISLYRRFGFTEQGRRPGFYSQPAEDALIMTRWL